MRRAGNAITPNTFPRRNEAAPAKREMKKDFMSQVRLSESISPSVVSNCTPEATRVSLLPGYFSLADFFFRKSSFVILNLFLAQIRG